MAHEVESMAWTGERPWHGLGVEVDNNLSPEEMLKLANLDWSVSKRPAYTLDAPDWSEEVGLINCPDAHFVVRDSDNAVLSPAGNDYVPVQNEDIFKFFDKFTKNGNMTMETAGSLKGGREIWGLAKINQDIHLPGGDDVEGYLLINQPHAVGKAMTIKLTPIRVVCNNTLTMALNQEGQAAFRMPHVRAFDQDVSDAAEQALGLSKESMKAFGQQVAFLAKTQAPTGKLLQYITELYQPQILIDQAKGLIPKDAPLREHFNSMARLVDAAVENSPGHEMRSARGTWWGALNAVTYIEDHGRSETVPGNALHSAWFGAGANRKARALAMATKYARAA